MKKSKLVLVVLTTILSATLLVGCGNQQKKLVCTQTASGVDIEFNVGFKGKVISSMDFNYDMDLSKYSDTQIKAIEKQDFCSAVKNSMSQYKSAFTKCDQKVESKHLKVDSVLDVDKVAKDISEKLTTPEKAKEELEKQGYKCIIK